MAGLPHFLPRSCLIAMALKSSKTGSLPVSEIYSFMKEHFPYFKVRLPAWVEGGGARQGHSHDCPCFCFFFLT